jgi:hypothetical protein
MAVTIIVDGGNLLAHDQDFFVARAPFMVEGTRFLWAPMSVYDIAMQHRPEESVSLAH